MGRMNPRASVGRRRKENLANVRRVGGEVPKEAGPRFLGERFRFEPRGEGIESGGKACPGAILRDTGPENVARLGAGNTILSCCQEKEKEVRLVRIVEERGIFSPAEHGRSEELKPKVGEKIVLH